MIDPLNPSPSRFRQRGIVSIVAAILLIAAVVFVLSQTFGIIGNTSNSNASQGDSVKAFFLAESGVERAEATIKKALDGGSYGESYCTSSGNWPEQSLGSGKKFEYTPLPTCSGTNCAECNVTVKGTVNSSARSIRVRISTMNTQGTAECGSTPSLTVKATASNSAVFTNMAYRSKAPNPSLCPGQTTGGSNAKVGYCFNTGLNNAGGPSGNCIPATDGWDLQRTGNTNVSGMGVFSLVNKDINNTYTISQELWDNSDNQTIRDYVQVGVLFAPTTPPGTVTLAGSYGVPGDTTGTSTNPTGTLPSTWLCGATNGTGTAQRAAAANTLVFGFSSWPADNTTYLNAVTLGSQPFRRQIMMQNNLADMLYSQIWYSYNTAYDPGTGVTANAGAVITGTIGAEFKAHTSGTPATELVLDASVNPDEILTEGDEIWSSNVMVGTLGALLSGTAGSNNSRYAFTPSPSGLTLGNNTAVTARSNKLRLVSAPSSGVLALDDSITSPTSSGATTYATINAVPVSGQNTAGAVYTLSAKAQVSHKAPNPTTNNLWGQSVKVNLTGTPTAPATQPTAVAAYSGSGQFSKTVVSGSIGVSTIDPINQSTLTIDPGSSELKVGDALFGVNIKANTKIVAKASDTSFEVTPQQTAAIATIIARTAIMSSPAPTANSITVSRPVRLSGASICGGICTFLTDGSGTTYTLTGLTSGDDWASGFACLSGVDPDSIRTLGSVSTKKTGWTEVIQ